MPVRVEPLASRGFPRPGAALEMQDVVADLKTQRRDASGFAVLKERCAGVVPGPDVAIRLEHPAAVRVVVADSLPPAHLHVDPAQERKQARDLVPVPIGRDAFLADEDAFRVEKHGNIPLDQDVRIHQDEAFREEPEEFLDGPAVLRAAPVVPGVGFVRELIQECAEVDGLATGIVDDPHVVHSAEREAVRVVKHSHPASGRVFPQAQDGSPGQIRGVVVHRADILFHHYIS